MKPQNYFLKLVDTVVQKFFLLVDTMEKLVIGHKLNLPAS